MPNDTTAASGAAYQSAPLTEAVAALEATRRERDHLAEQVQTIRRQLTGAEALAEFRLGVIHRYREEIVVAGQEIKQLRAQLAAARTDHDGPEATQ